MFGLGFRCAKSVRRAWGGCGADIARMWGGYGVDVDVKQCETGPVRLWGDDRCGVACQSNVKRVRSVRRDCLSMPRRNWLLVVAARLL